jgi:hypothetical protein
MTKPEYQPLFWLEISIGALALIYTFLGLLTWVPRLKGAERGRSRRTPHRGGRAKPEDSFAGRLSVSSGTVIPALGIMVAAVAGIYSNPYTRQFNSVKATALIEQVSTVSGDPCFRRVVVDASLPTGDVVAVGSMRQGQSEVDFQSSAIPQGEHRWSLTVEVGDHTETGDVFFLTPIVLPAAQERDLLDVIRTSASQDQTSTYWPSTGPPSSAVYIGVPRKVIHTSQVADCPQ